MTNKGFFQSPTWEVSVSNRSLEAAALIVRKYLPVALTLLLCLLSTYAFIHFYQNGLGLAYNDARSHLNIGRRVVEGLKPGLAQIGSVWLPLNHIFMVPTIWQDFMWHSGLAGAVQSMVAFVATGLVIYKLLEKIGTGVAGRLVAVAVFAANLNILYLSATAMTELLLLATMTAGVYYLVLWHQDNNVLNLVKSAFWIMLSTLTRYDGWFLLTWATGLVVLQTWRKGLGARNLRENYQMVEGTTILFLTLVGVGIALWFLWNQLIFKDAFYFAFGPFSAHAQQEQLRHAGVLATKGNILLSLKVYLYALMYNAYSFPVILGVAGAFTLWLDRRLTASARLATTALVAPFFFNVLALFLGFSVLFVQGISGDTWFNIRYGVMLAPSIAVFIGYLVDRLVSFRLVLVGLLAFTLFFALINADAVTIDDARVGSSQKNVSEVSHWLATNTKDKPGFILISAASHDAIIFSSGLPMKRFIHEGTGAYWESAVTVPDRWARWVIMRTHDDNDLTFRFVKKTPGFARYNLVGHYPFSDIYEIQPEYVSQLNTTPILGKLK